MFYVFASNLHVAFIVVDGFVVASFVAAVSVFLLLLLFYFLLLLLLFL